MIAQDEAMIAMEDMMKRMRTMIDKYNEAGIDPTMEIEADGFITRPETLERISQSRAKPIEVCAYPKCEECDNYHGHYCTVPMVVSKQIYRFTADKIAVMEKRLTELETLVTNEILGSRKRAESPQEVNYTWADILGEDE